MGFWDPGSIFDPLRGYRILIEIGGSKLAEERSQYPNIIIVGPKYST